MRRRRLRGFGCLGCLPMGGLLFAALPIIAIGALVYFLVNRQRTAPQPPPPPYIPPVIPPTPPPPPPAPSPTATTTTSLGFCSRCGAPLTGGKFCPNCGAPV